MALKSHHPYSVPRREIDATVGRILAYLEVGKLIPAQSEIYKLEADLRQLHTRISREVSAARAKQAAAR